jgi:hypothetical protein
MKESGNYVWPILIFKRIRIKIELRRRAPPGTLSTCSESGGRESEISDKRLESFIFSVKPTTKEKFLPILDGHHTRARAHTHTHTHTHTHLHMYTRTDTHTSTTDGGSTHL